MKDIGSSIANDASSAAGWVANGIDSCLGLDPVTTSSAVGNAVSKAT